MPASRRIRTTFFRSVYSPLILTPYLVRESHLGNDFAWRDKWTLLLNPISLTERQVTPDEGQSGSVAVQVAAIPWLPLDASDDLLFQPLDHDFCSHR